MAKVLFLPVSGPLGMGEYARSAAIAARLAAHRPAVEIQFMLSREAPYAAAVPFATTLLPASPTLSSPEVIRHLQEWRPDIVVFDNAGRSAQIDAAVRAGAEVVYISARSRQRRRAFRVGWMGLLTEHWIAYPAAIAGAPRYLERLKLRWLGRPTLRYLDVILAHPTPQERALAERLAAQPRGFVLFVPGGGTAHPGAADAPAQFRMAANLLAATERVVFVGPDSATQEPLLPAVERLERVSQGELGELMRAARLLITNGGSTLLQGIACGAACVAVPVAGDQAARAATCTAMQVAVAAPLAGATMARAAHDLLLDEHARRALATRAAALTLADGVEVAARALGSLLDAREPPA
jgi:spore coat polysaccharide biosynthesis predicted glycosyltransferase SpsG